MTMKPTIIVVVAILFLELLALATINISFCNGSSYVGCFESERQALLRFKQDLKDPSNRLASWTGDGDCCTWAGVVCDNLTGRVLELRLRNPLNAIDSEAYERSMLVGKINLSSLEFKHLIYLDLSNNNFQGIHIPKFLGSMENLEYLNLSGAGFGGMIPHQLGNLSNLQYLDLSRNHWLDVPNFFWLSDLSLLKHLDLSHVYLGRAYDWLLVTNTLPSLQVLRLSGCELHHFPLLSITNFSALATLDLSNNRLDNSLIQCWDFGHSHLIFLDLSHNNLQGSIPDQLRNLTSLQYLGLSYNHFSSAIPSWLYRFSHLEYLSLSHNSLQGTISSSMGNLTSVRSLDLSFNKLEGRIPRSLGRFCNLKSISMSHVHLSQEVSEIFDIFSGCVVDRLKSLDLSNTQLFGILPYQLGQFQNLHTLFLNDNSISSFIPLSLGKLSSLRYLDFSNNGLNGTLSQIHFANLTRLLVFNASGNSLMFKVSHNWIPPFELKVLGLRSCYLGPQFPSWLFSQNHLTYLDISNSGLVDTIPNSVWRSLSTCYYLNLSNNQIYGEIPNLSGATQLEILDLSSNKFSGPLPLISSNVVMLDLFDNNLSGSILHFLCHEMNESKHLQILNLGDNLLSGDLPDCWMNWHHLLVLKLNNNRFTGSIPNSMGTLSFLLSLHLRNNSMSGRIPLSLKNCTKLVAVDIGENEFFGNIPTWIGERFSRMKILNLRSNKFDSFLPTELCRLVTLQILDLANNKLSGTIPRCINNFSAMTTSSHSVGPDHIEYGFGSHSSMGIFIEDALLMGRGRLYEYKSILNWIKLIDLSKNNFSGEIPEEVTNLKTLVSLNLSHNYFTGRIPQNIGAMKSLQSIDLSENQLYGEIPSSMTDLYLLTCLNLSNNYLTGEIPLVGQLATFDASSFTGNELCGGPLPKNCTVSVPIPDNENEGKDDDEHEVNWVYESMNSIGFVISATLGFVVGFWTVIGSLFVNRRCGYIYSIFLNELGAKFCSVVKKCC